MNCPKCSKAMVGWKSEVYDEEDEMPTFVQLSGYGCHYCKKTFLSLDISDFDGYTIGKEIVEKCNSKYLFVSGANIDPEEAKVMQVKNMYIKKVTDEGVVFLKVND